MQSAHLSVSNINTTGLASAVKRSSENIIAIDVLLMYLRYTYTNRSSSFCSFAKIGYVTFDNTPNMVLAGSCAILEPLE